LLAVCAVRYEPVSAGKFPVNRENTGNILISTAQRASLEQKTAPPQGFISKFPAQIIRENLRLLGIESFENRHFKTPETSAQRSAPIYW
jgi:hypothetical protein